ncbi:hypothetical protein PDESU_02758 [Pontiella desulfatans]|uniref:CAAX prenyl protease 2/Lysostaphin resistance protein A-like domain-containing protein n=1 Tax=Pontiella desulfatans TaxID=2750659 RepID=A0A6C2U318_PONDE|nr:type II CAAX endopeptidase family protein [Pontiella desulfatans]VGO14199.1 hypothetical protein PDESU_02758 [Pontiella desulfatans]
MEELLANTESGIRELFRSIEYVLLVCGLFTLLLFALHRRRNPPDTPTLNRQLANRALGAVEIFSIVQLYLVLLFLAMFSGRLFYEEQIPTAKLGIALLIYTLVSLAIFTNNRRRKKTMASGFGMGLAQLRYAGLAPFFYLAIVPLLLVSGALLKWLGYELPLQENAQQFVESNPAQRILFAVMAIVAAPFFEELLFRGILLPALLKRMGLACSTLLVSCLFALMHFNFLLLLIAFTPAAIVCILLWPSQKPWLRGLARVAFGLVLLSSAGITFANGSFHSFVSLMILSSGVSLAYWRTGSLWTSIGMHAIFNGVTLYTLNMVG